MKKLILICSAVISCLLISAQYKTDVSLAWKDSTKQESSISTPTGDLYKKVKHHGPAVENQWIGLRLYFDKKVSIDAYNKTRPGLELAEAGWYPTPEQQQQGWGSDQYKVGSTVGLGGIHLWDGEKEVLPDPVTLRTARVKRGKKSSYMEMQSDNIPYKGDSVSINVRVTVYNDKREAKVDAYVIGKQKVQFFTGLNYHSTSTCKEGTNYICTWGLHPEDVAAFPLEIGAAIIYNPKDFVSVNKEKKQFVLISKPTKHLRTWISSAGAKEPVINSLEPFVKYLESIAK